MGRRVGVAGLLACDRNGDHSDGGLRRMSRRAGDVAEPEAERDRGGKAQKEPGPKSRASQGRLTVGRDGCLHVLAVLLVWFAGLRPARRRLGLNWTAVPEGNTGRGTGFRYLSFSPLSGPDRAPQPATAPRPRRGGGSRPRVQRRLLPAP